MNKEQLGTILALLTAVVSGVAIPANKIFIVKMDPLVFTAVRAVIIGVVFLVVAYWQFGKNKKPKAKFISVNWKYLAGIAIIGGAIAFYLYFAGLKLTTAGHAAFLHKTLPLYTAILAYIFLKERITKKYAVAMLLMIVGSAAIYLSSILPTDLWMNPQLGDLLVITAAFLWAVENIISKKAMTSGENNFIVSFARMFFGGLILFGAIILLGKADALFTLTSQQMINLSVSTLLLLGYVFFYYWAIKLINVSKAAVLLLVAPVVSLVLGIMFLGEPSPVLQLLGSAIILIGAYLIVGLKSEQRGI
ncbi:MAG: DMT family transporter [Candidatus Aenigmarchaeota archaeon]|nr:DMT family transporter [Candidatus Aenigmarchaeota archaeon]